MKIDSNVSRTSFTTRPTAAKSTAATLLVAPRPGSRQTAPPSVRDSFQATDPKQSASHLLSGQARQPLRTSAVGSPAAVTATPAYQTQKALSEKRQQLGKDMQEMQMYQQMIVQAPLTGFLYNGKMNELDQRIGQTKKDVAALERVAATQPKNEVQRASFQVFNERLGALEAQVGKNRAAQLARQTYYNNMQFNGSAGTIPASEAELLAAGFPKNPLMMAPNGDVIDMGHVACALDWKLNPSIANLVGADLAQVTLTGDLSAAALAMGRGKQSAAAALKAEASPADLYGDIDGLNLTARMDAQPDKSLADTLKSYYGSNSKNRIQEFAVQSPYVFKDAKGQPRKDDQGNFLLDKAKLTDATIDFAMELRQVGHKKGVDNPTLVSNSAQVVDQWKTWFDQESRRPAVKPRVS